MGPSRTVAVIPIQTFDNFSSFLEVPLMNPNTKNLGNQAANHADMQSHQTKPKSLASAMEANVLDGMKRNEDTDSVKVPKIVMTSYTGPAPVKTVKELRKIFSVTKNKKQYFTELAQNEYFVEESARNMFAVLDTNRDGSLQLEELKGVFDVLVRRCAKIVMGFSWGLGPIVRKQAKTIFHKKLMPTSSSSEGADLLNLKVLVRNTMLFCAGVSQSDVEKVSEYFYKIGRVDYSCVSVAQTTR